MKNTEKNETIGKGNLLFDCKLFATGKGTASRPACIECNKKYSQQYQACITAAAAAAKPNKAKTEKAPARVPGFWGYAKGSFTDIFCNAICEKPMTMNQAAAIIDTVSGLPIGPHPKCKKRLITEGLAVFDSHLIYMRVWPKGHSEAGKLTPAAKLYREMQSKKTDTKKAA